MNRILAFESDQAGLAESPLIFVWTAAGSAAISLESRYSSSWTIWSPSTVTNMATCTVSVCPSAMVASTRCRRTALLPTISSSSSRYRSWTPARRVLEGSFTYEDTSGAAGVVPTEGVEWFRSGHGAWHGGWTGDAQRIRGFQLWVALPPEQELGSADSVYLQSESVPRDGPVIVLLGDYGRLSSPLRLPSSITYLDVQMKAGKRWSYQPPAGHTVCWIAVANGAVLTPEQVDAGELAAFEPCNDAVEFEARSDTEFVLGSAVKHPHELALGRYSVHTNSDALRKGEARIKQIKEHLVAEGRL
jgi:Pirin